MLLENEADQYANNTLINQAEWLAFMKQNPTFRYGDTERSIRTLAVNTKLHPSIILGRYCFETKNYAIKTKIERSFN